MLRPTLWFATASMGMTILHEVVHACTAYALGVRSTLYNYSAELDLTPAQANTNLPALIRFAGPTACLALGLLSWFAYRRARNAGARLPLLYFSVFGFGTFCGNLMSTAFVGDFSAIAVALRVPMAVRYAIAIVGAFSVAAVHLWAGRELIQRVPAHVGRVVGTLGIIVLPVLWGTAAIVLVNQPMPRASVGARAVEGAFWSFAAIGALVTRRRSPNNLGRFELRWGDGLAVLFAVAVVRVLVRGIPFVPS